MKTASVTLTNEEQGRLVVLNAVIGGGVTVSEAAQATGLSVRQMQRMLAAYRVGGAAAVAHGNRGRQPVHTLAAELVTQITALAREDYRTLNDSHLSDVLREEHGIDVSRATVRRIRIAAGLVRPRARRPPAHRQRRERRAQPGMLLQVDCSDHAWLGTRGPRLTLVAAIDDATGVVPSAHFRMEEDAAGYLELLRALVTTVGTPQAWYHDRHGIFRRLPQERSTLDEDLAGAREPTQVGRALRDLGIASIAAHSPQAKGRIERLFGTLQDRLVADLHRAGATTLAEANVVLTRFLPHFNTRFAVPAQNPTSAFGPLVPPTEAWQVCCFRYLRTVANDDTVQLGEHRLQLLPTRQRASYARAKVEIREHLDGSLSVWHAGHQIAHQVAPADAPRLRARSGRGALNPAPPAILPDTPPDDLDRNAWVQSLSPPEPPPASTQAPPARPRPNHPWRHPFSANATESLDN